MGMFELIDLMSSKEGYELYDKIEKILNNFNIDAHRADGTIKDLYELCCDVAEVLNKGK